MLKKFSLSGLGKCIGNSMKSMHTDTWVYMVNCNSLERIILFLATTCMSKYDLFHVNVKKILYQQRNPQHLPHSPEKHHMCTAYNVLLSFSCFSPIKVWQIQVVEKSFMSEFSAINRNSKEKKATKRQKQKQK